jgi:hypothetical protein
LIAAEHFNFDPGFARPAQVRGKDIEEPKRVARAAQGAVGKSEPSGTWMTRHSAEGEFHCFIKQHSGVIKGRHSFTLEAAVILLTQMQIDVPKNYASRLKLLRASPMQRL